MGMEGYSIHPIHKTLNQLVFHQNYTDGNPKLNSMNL